MMKQRSRGRGGGYSIQILWYLEDQLPRWFKLKRHKQRRPGFIRYRSSSPWATLGKWRRASISRQVVHSTPEALAPGTHVVCHASIGGTRWVEVRHSLLQERGCHLFCCHQATSSTSTKYRLRSANYPLTSLPPGLQVVIRRLQCGAKPSFSLIFQLRSAILH